MRCASVAAIVVLALLAPAGASADVPRREVALPETRVTLSVPTAWMQVEVPGVVAAFRSDAGHALAVTRSPVANIDAWRPRTRETYIDQIERGITRGIPKYKRIARKIADINGVPVLDLEARRERTTTVLVRVILYRTYALALAIEVPRGAALADARAITAAFAPPPPPPAPPS